MLPGLVWAVKHRLGFGKEFVAPPQTQLTPSGRPDSFSGEEPPRQQLVHCGDNQLLRSLGQPSRAVVEDYRPATLVATFSPDPFREKRGDNLLQTGRAHAEI